MKKFNALNKRNGKEFVVTMMDDKILAFDVEKGVEKEVSANTIKRWYDLGEEVIEEVIEEVVEEVVEIVEVKVNKVDEMLSKILPNYEEVIEENKNGKKKERTDKFKPKLTDDQILEIDRRLKLGHKQSHLAKEFGVSNQTIRCIRFRWMHKKLLGAC